MSETTKSENEVTERVEVLLGQMSLAEKVAQLAQIGGADWNFGPKAEDIIRERGAGSVLWLNDTKKFNQLQKIAVEESPSGIPILFALDVIHGYRTIFPIPLALAASDAGLRLHWPNGAGRLSSIIAAMKLLHCRR
jgi:beta-glucosidase